MNKLIVVFLGLSLGGVCFAGDAVSAPNGKVSISTGSLDSYTEKSFMGSFTVPLGTNFGFQADVLYSDIDDTDLYGAGAHLFWRDSDKGLLGITLGGVHQEYVDAWSAGLEGEYYLGNFTLGARGGFAALDFAGGPFPFFDTDQDDYYVAAEVGFYPIDNLLLSLSHTFAFGNGLTQGKLEYQTPLRGVSLYADFGQGDNNYDHALVGLRYYFGEKDKSLKNRHRQDDPANMLNPILYHIGTSSAEFGNKMEEYHHRLFDDSLRSGGFSGDAGPFSGGSGGSGGGSGGSWSAFRFSDTFSVDSDITAIPQ